ncbi:MAG: IS66 family insertion sequence element accessory protein TnpB [Lachnospirales bacterium]
MDPFQGSSIFIFCNKKRDGFILASKKLMEDMRLQWQKMEEEAKEITMHQVDWLQMGLSIEQKKVFRDV